MYLYKLVRDVNENKTTQAVLNGISVKFRLCQRAKAPGLKMTDCLEPAISVCSEDPKRNVVSELSPPARGFAWLIRKSGSHIFFPARIFLSPLIRNVFFCPS